jgi:hypothetical protein
MNPFERMAELVEQGRERMASTQSIIKSQDKKKAMQDRINKIFDKYKTKPEDEKPEGSN